MAYVGHLHPLGIYIIHIPGGCGAKVLVVFSLSHNQDPQLDYTYAGSRDRYQEAGWGTRKSLQPPIQDGGMEWELWQKTNR